MAGEGRLGTHSTAPMTMLDNVVWALVLVAILVAIVRRVGGPRPPGSPGSIAARLRAAEDELRELRGEIRLLVERVWFLDEGRPAPP